MGNTLQTPPQIPPSQTHQQDVQEEVFKGALEQPSDQFTCEICIEPVPGQCQKFNNGEKCSHPFCTDCMIKYIHVQLEEYNEGKITCPAANCDHVLDPFDCVSLLNPPLFVRWCDVLCERAIVDSDKFYCPYRDCNELVLNECGGIVKKSKCPKCKRWFCFECKMVWHAGFLCEESGELSDRNDVALGRLAEERKWRRCPRCKHFVELREGCQIVKCRCGVSFCYKCGKQVHQHWCSCDTTSACLGWCFRLMMILAVLTLAFFFCLWHIRTTQHRHT